MTDGPRAVAIGASAGAVQALSIILPQLPADYPLPVLVVVHVPAEPSSLATLFDAKCRLSVREPEDKDPIEGGAIYFAPAGYHMLVENDRTIALSTDEPLLFSRPSIDILFETAAESYRGGLVGVVLTGANEDGARGAHAVSKAGGTVLIEDPGTAFAAAMPAAALARCPATQPRSLDEIAKYLVDLGTK